MDLYIAVTSDGMQYRSAVEFSDMRQ